jgi:hypothetical protein
MKTRSLDRIALLIIFALSLSACKKGEPIVSQLKLLNGFQLDQSIIPVMSKTNPAFSVTGRCDSRFEDFELSTDGGLTWKKVRELSTDYHFDCDSNATFSASIDFSKAQLNSSRWNTAGSYNDLFFRGVSSTFGPSVLQKVRLDVAIKSKFLTTGMSAGSSRQSLSGGYMLNDQVSVQSSHVQVSNGYRLEGSIAW